MRGQKVNRFVTKLLKAISRKSVTTSTSSLNTSSLMSYFVLTSYWSAFNCSQVVKTVHNSYMVSILSWRSVDIKQGILHTRQVGLLGNKDIQCQCVKLFGWEIEKYASWTMSIASSSALKVNERVVKRTTIENKKSWKSWELSSIPIPHKQELSMSKTQCRRSAHFEQALQLIRSTSAHLKIFVFRYSVCEALREHW